MGSRILKDAAAFVFACLMGAGFVQYHARSHYDPHIVWDGFTLPGFDAHVYVAMAEEPRFFTVGPWGYRILLPGILGALLPPRLIVPGFEWAARLSLVAASGLLFVYLRVRGSTIRASLLAVAAMMATPSVSAVFANPFLVEPFALVLLLLALILIEGGGGSWAISLSLLLLALTKEIWVFLLPLIFAGERKSGTRAAWGTTLRLAGPAIWVSLLLRAMWAPQTVWAWPGSGSIDTLISAVFGMSLVAPQFLLGGFALAGVLGLGRTEAREYLREHAFTLLALTALPLAAAVYTGAGASASFFTDDVRRLLIYVLPFVAALAVYIDPEHASARMLPPAPRVDTTLRFAVIVLALAPLGLDRYWRVDLSTTRDGPYVLGTIRESLRAARKLDRGDTVVFDPSERKFAWGVSPPAELGKLRFFLRDGFGDLAHYGIDDIKMRDRSATLIIPVLKPRPLKVTLHLDARESAWVAILAGGTKVGEALVGPQAVAVTVQVSGANLFRGDNPIVLECENAPTALPRILRIELSQATAGS